MAAPFLLPGLADQVLNGYTLAAVQHHIVRIFLNLRPIQNADEVNANTPVKFRPCLINSNVTNGERFFRQTRRFDAGILCVFHTAHAKRAAYRALFLLSPVRKSNAVWRKKIHRLGIVVIFQTRPKHLYAHKFISTASKETKSVV